MDQRKRFGSFFFSLLLIGIGFTSLGCAQEQDTLVPEPPEPQIVTKKEKWCSGEDDYYRDISELAKKFAPGITIEACFPGGAGEYQIETIPFDPQQKDTVLKKGSDFPVTKLLAYFKIKYQNEYVSKFDTPLELRITYSSNAWEDLPRGYAFPRLAYLVPVGEGWGNRWVEFNSAEFELVLPDSSEAGGSRILYLRLKELPDPLIGGC